MFTLNRHIPLWGIVLYGLSSLTDGLVMILSCGTVVSHLRLKTSLWLASRETKNV